MQRAEQDLRHTRARHREQVFVGRGLSGGLRHRLRGHHGTDGPAEAGPKKLLVQVGFGDAAEVSGLIENLYEEAIAITEQERADCIESIGELHLDDALSTLVGALATLRHVVGEAGHLSSEEDS